jgi:uncharacterized protein YndB with AHSA1/START domain
MTDAALASRSIVVERLIPHSPRKVWRALTESALIAEWLMQNDFQPVVGCRFNFRAQPIPYWNGVTDCEVLEVSPPSRLVYSWNASGDEAADGLKTVVAWTLTPADGGVLVRMEQSGFRPEDEDGYVAMGGGWPRIVERLGEVAGLLTD